MENILMLFQPSFLTDQKVQDIREVCIHPGAVYNFFGQNSSKWLQTYGTPCMKLLSCSPFFTSTGLWPNVRFQNILLLPPK